RVWNRFPGSRRRCAAPRRACNRRAFAVERKAAVSHSRRARRRTGARVFSYPPGDMVEDLRKRQVATGPRTAPRPSVDQAIPQAKALVLRRLPPAAASAQPKTTGLTTPAPKPITDRTA